MATRSRDAAFAGADVEDAVQPILEKEGSEGAAAPARPRRIAHLGGAALAAAAVFAGGAALRRSFSAEATVLGRVGLGVLRLDSEGAGAKNSSDAANVTGECGGIWEICGGDLYHGPKCCKKGFECVAKPIEGYPTYRQCAPIPRACEDMEGRKDRKCYYKVTWDMTTGIFSQPQNYHGLTKDSSFKEFQEQNWMLMKEKSECPPPCGPGTCYQVLRYEGCDQHIEWGCGKDDETLGYHCCCKAYHQNLTAVPIKELVGLKDKPKLFCVALMLPNTYEVDLLREQLKRDKMGMFSCDKWVVVSNETVSLKPGSKDKKFETIVMEGSLEAKRGGDYNTSMNTGIFQRFWKTVLSKTDALDYDWVVKMDPDTLFMVDRMQALLASKKNQLANPESAAGRYLNNCFLGMHGPIEAISKNAMKNYKDNQDKCINGDPATHGQEDWYMRECFKMLGVEEVPAYNLLLEGDWACKERPSAWKPDYRPPCFSPQVAFHPFKDIDSYMHCWAEAISVGIPFPLDPIQDEPTPFNERHG